MKTFSNSTLKETYDRLNAVRPINEAYGVHPDALSQYLMTALWADGLDDDYGVEDISSDGVEGAKQDLSDLIDKMEAGGLLEPYLNNFGGEAWANLGHDLLLTRNGHGAGFWDREYKSDANLGKLISKVVDDNFKEVQVYMGDHGKIEIDR